MCARYIFQGEISIQAESEDEAWMEMSEVIANATSVDDLFILYDTEEGIEEDEKLE